MQVTAHLRRLRMSPTKVRLVGELIRGLDVAVADAQLIHSPKAAARAVRKLLHSAIANAEHNAKLSRGNLFVRQVLVNQGPALKRWRPRAFGRAAAIRKQTSHVTVILDERVPTAARATSSTPSATPAPKVVQDRSAAIREAVPGEGGVSREHDANATWKQDGVGERGGKRQRGFLRRFLNRRSGER